VDRTYSVDDLDVVAAKVVPCRRDRGHATDGCRGVRPDGDGGRLRPGRSCLYQAGEHIGAELIYETGTMGWNELTTRDAEKALIFFNDVLGWTRRTQAPGCSHVSRDPEQRSHRGWLHADGG
jgi:hypothetical protein